MGKSTGCVECYFVVRHYLNFEYMLKKLILIALPFMPFCLNGQKNYYLKLYPIANGYGRVSDLSYDKGNIATPAGYAREIDLVTAPILSLQIEKTNGWSWEIGAGGFAFTRSDDRADFFTSPTLVILGTEKSSRMEVQVENFKRVFVNEKKSTAFSWGIFTNLHYQHLNFKPASALSGWYELDEKEGVMAFGLVPRLQTNLTRRLHFDLNIPVNLFTLGYAQSFVNNPALTPDQNTSNIVDFDYGGRLALRFGLGWRLNKTKHI